MSVTLKLRKDKWQVVGTITRHDGKSVRLRRATGHTFHEKAWASKKMASILLDAMAEVDAPAIDVGVTTVGDVIRVFAARPDGLSVTDKLILGRFDKAFGARDIGDLTSLEVDRYFAAMGVKGSTIRRYMTTMAACFNFVRGKGLPVPDIKFGKPSDGDGRCRWLDVRERDEFIAAFEDEEARSIAAFLFFTGARLGEVWKLDDKDVMAGEVILRTRKGKTKKLRARRIPLHPSIRAMVEKRAETRGPLFTRTNKHGQRVRWANEMFYREVRPTLEVSGIEDFKCHDMRHTFASHLIQNVATLKAVADLLGHTSLAMVMRYAHLGSSHLADTVGLLEGGGVSIDTKLTRKKDTLSKVEVIDGRGQELVSPYIKTINQDEIEQLPIGIDLSKAVSIDKFSSSPRTKDEEDTHPKAYTPDKE